jgi:hypothetical protein
LLERAPLYILSRQVFGEEVRWQDALRAWPRQLGGGWFRMLTWWRPFVASRGLYQPIWQLEGARGAVASERRKVIGKENTARSAFWYGVVCAHFESILYIGFLAFVGIFLSPEDAINPFAYLTGDTDKSDSPLVLAVTFAGYALAGGIIGPIYTACCFTLYLNRRATLEAWDIEIMLRQIKPPLLKKPRADAGIALLWPIFSCIATLLLAMVLCQTTPVEAAGVAEKRPAPDAEKCEKPEWAKSKNTVRSPDFDAAQTRLREEVAQIFQAEDLRTYSCEEAWYWKKSPEDKTVKKSDSGNSGLDLETLAAIIKIVLIAVAICLVAWTLHRYRGQFDLFYRRKQAEAAIEIGGLDIRPESLPDDVAGAVRQLWENGERRAALALLYRASLSRLASQHGLLLTEGATETDCLRLADHAFRKHKLDAASLTVVTKATDLWLNGAYGDRWPGSETVLDACAAWQAQFGASVMPRQVLQ